MEKQTHQANVPKLIIVYELILGLFELSSGFGIFLFGSKLLSLYEGLKRTELIQDPNDLMVRLTEKLIPNLFAHHITIALLLFLFGTIKITSGIGLLFRKIWAEYLLVIFLTILVPFELLAFLKNLSLTDFIYLLIDIVIILYLIKLKPVEYYRKLKQDLYNRNHG